tara:strand:- start:4227 stop:5381 length:1155 start_codon:yes stop_codon:yes gene_type:complete
MPVVARVLHLFNILGASTEAMWLAYAELLANRGHSVTCGYESVGDAGGACELNQVCIPRIHVEDAEDIAAQMSGLTGAPSSGEIEALLGDEIELVHGHGGTRILHAAPWISRGIPTVISLYGYDASRLLCNPCWVSRYRWAAERGTAFVVLHESMRVALIECGIASECIRTIALGIDLTQWPRADASPNPSDPPRFVFVGRLVPKKAPGVVVEAMAMLFERYGVTAQLDIVGDGPLRHALESQIEALGLSTQIQMHGAVPRDRVATVLRGASALLLPSTKAPDGDCEGTPVVLMEAQALGVPCITTEHAGNADVIAPSMRSFVIDRADAESLAISMYRFLRVSSKEQLALAESGRDWVESEFNIDRTALEYDALYGQLIGPGSE